MANQDEGVDKKPVAPADEQGVNDSGAPAEEIVVEPDWKELLRIERERSEKAEEERDNYKQGLLSRKRQEKAQRDAAATEEEPETVAEAVQKALAPVLSSIQGNKIDQILSSIVTDPSKREYVRAIYQTRIQRTGTSDDAIRTDLEAALALADSARRAKENEELKRMNDNRTYVPPAGAGGGSPDRGSPQKAHKWSPEQEASLEMRARANGISDVEKYKELAWKAAQDGSAFAVKPKYIK